MKRPLYNKYQRHRMEFNSLSFLHVEKALRKLLRNIKNILTEKLT